MREPESIFIEAGEIRESGPWKNIYLKFLHKDGSERWYYFSEHENKPPRLRQIDDFLNGKVKPGDTMDISYEIKQASNKSTTLRMTHYANHNPKN